ncbi:MAG TPA: hypothetical protein VGR27_11735 [Longimicrobiaceae bacterium]|nr:hypothetical protein [Longimicrobiaceae bacterium]
MQTASPSVAEWKRRAAELLHDLGLEGVRVDDAGHQGEIAALLASSDVFDRLVERTPEIVADLRELGFRYVALDLEDAEETEPQLGGAE